MIISLVFMDAQQFNELIGLFIRLKAAHIIYKNFLEDNVNLLSLDRYFVLNNNRKLVNQLLDKKRDELAAIDSKIESLMQSPESKNLPGSEYDKKWQIFYQQKVLIECDCLFLTNQLTESSQIYWEYARNQDFMRCIYNLAPFEKAQDELSKRLQELIKENLKHDVDIFGLIFKDTLDSPTITFDEFFDRVNRLFESHYSYNILEKDLINKINKILNSPIWKSNTISKIELERIQEMKRWFDKNQEIPMNLKLNHFIKYLSALKPIEPKNSNVNLFIQSIIKQDLVQIEQFIIKDEIQNKLALLYVHSVTPKQIKIEFTRDHQSKTMENETKFQQVYDVFLLTEACGQLAQETLHAAQFLVAKLIDIEKEISKEQSSLDGFKKANAKLEDNKSNLTSQREELVNEFPEVNESIDKKFDQIKKELESNIAVTGTLKMVYKRIVDQKKKEYNQFFEEHSDQLTLCTTLAKLSAYYYQQYLENATPLFKKAHPQYSDDTVYDVLTHLKLSPLSLLKENSLKIPLNIYLDKLALLLNNSYWMQLKYSGEDVSDIEIFAKLLTSVSEKNGEKILSEIEKKAAAIADSKPGFFSKEKHAEVLSLMQALKDRDMITLEKIKMKCSFFNEDKKRVWQPPK